MNNDDNNLNSPVIEALATYFRRVGYKVEEFKTTVVEEVSVLDWKLDNAS